MNFSDFDNDDKENKAQQNEVVKYNDPKRNSLVECTNFTQLEGTNFTQRSPEENTTVSTKSNLSPMEVLMREQHLDAANIQRQNDFTRQQNDFTRHLQEQSTARMNILKELVKKKQ